MENENACTVHRERGRGDERWVNSVDSEQVFLNDDRMIFQPLNGSMFSILLLLFDGLNGC